VLNEGLQKAKRMVKLSVVVKWKVVKWKVALPVCNASLLKNSDALLATL
jgi:hypothetical protein